jgi:hypothetical protein
MLCLIQITNLFLFFFDLDQSIARNIMLIGGTSNHIRRDETAKTGVIGGYNEKCAHCDDCNPVTAAILRDRVSWP